MTIDIHCQRCRKGYRQEIDSPDQAQLVVLTWHALHEGHDLKLFLDGDLFYPTGESYDLPPT